MKIATFNINKRLTNLQVWLESSEPMWFACNRCAISPCAKSTVVTDIGVPPSAGITGEPRLWCQAQGFGVDAFHIVSLHLKLLLQQMG
jgi:hypothetical protein